MIKATMEIITARSTLTKKLLKRLIIKYMMKMNIGTLLKKKKL